MGNNTKIFVCKINWWNKEDVFEYILCNAKDYRECVEEISSYYDNYNITNIISLEMTPLEDGPITISEDLAKLFIKGEPQYFNIEDYND